MSTRTTGELLTDLAAASAGKDLAAAVAAAVELGRRLERLEGDPVVIAEVVDGYHSAPEPRAIPAPQPLPPTPRGGGRRARLSCCPTCHSTVSDADGGLVHEPGCTYPTRNPSPPPRALT